MGSPRSFWLWGAAAHVVQLGEQLVACSRLQAWQVEDLFKHSKDHYPYKSERPLSSSGRRMSF